MLTMATVPFTQMAGMARTSATIAAPNEGSSVALMPAAGRNATITRTTQPMSMRKTGLWAISVRAMHASRPISRSAGDTCESARSIGETGPVPYASAAAPPPIFTWATMLVRCSRFRAMKPVLSCSGR